MALKGNVFTVDHEAFLESLADLGHFQMLIGWQLRLAKDSVGRSLEVLEKQGLKGMYGATNGMSILNLFHDGIHDIRAPYGKRVSENTQLLPMADELERRFNSFLLVWIFEKMEQHIQALYGKLLFQLRGEVTVADKKDFHKRLPKMAGRQGTPQYYDAFAVFCWKRDDKRVIAAFEEHLAWNRIAQTACHGMSWREYLEVIAFCRHRIVHNDGRVSTVSMGSLSAGQKAFVKELLHASLYSPHEHLLPPTKLISGLFEAVGSYGWAIYVLLAERCGMVDESKFFRPKVGGKRKVKPG